VNPQTGREAATVPPRSGSRHLHAFLDAIFPGLGHLVAGRRRRAALFGLPVLAVLLGAVLALTSSSIGGLLGIALNPATILVLFGGSLILLVWRAIAVGSSLTDGRYPRLGRRDVLPMALLAVLLVAPHAFAGYVTEVAREEAENVIPETPTTAGAYTGDQGLPAEPDPSDFDLPSAGPSADPSPSVSPSATPVAPRQNVLIIGVDQGVGRNTFLTDTMIVVSLDPVGQTVSMVSIPRDMVDVPLPDGRKFRGKINGLVSFARHHPKQFPGSNGDGQDVLMGALGSLLGLKIDHFAQVNLQGFINVVSTLGGVDVDVSEGFCDPTYHEYGYPDGFAISAGRHHLNGNQALAFARVRKAAGESDFTRAARQQELLSAVRDRIKAGGFLSDPIGLLRALGKTVTTNIPRSLVPELADVAARVGRKQTYRAVLGHPFVKPGSDARGSIQIPDLKAIRALADKLFPDPGVTPNDKYQVPASSGHVAGSGVSNCPDPVRPRATPRPTPRPTPKPTAKPTAKPTPTVAPSSEPSAEALPS
jgi:LCP family protein required for cell wall assembly